jgi:hypothetical protein
MISSLSSLPLSTLMAAPIVASMEASLQAQTSKVDLILSVGFDEAGNLVTIPFDYPTNEVDPGTGEVRRVVKRLDIPLLMFMSFPELVVHEIEETFSARITEVEDVGERDSEQVAGFVEPVRLNVAPTQQSSPSARQSQGAFDLEIRMRAEIASESTGIEMLQRAAGSAVSERIEEEKTEELAREDVADEGIDEEGGA